MGGEGNFFLIFFFLSCVCMLFSKSRSRSGFWEKKKKKKKPAVVQISTRGFGIFSEVVPPRSARSPICQNKHFSKKKSSVPCACGAAKLREVAYSSVAYRGFARIFHCQNMGSKIDGNTLLRRRFPAVRIFLMSNYQRQCHFFWQHLGEPIPVI